MILVGDCLERLRDLPDGSVHTCVTSPPYFGLRDYGHDGQIGLEATPAEYVAKLVAVFREVRRVLRDDGTLWLNLGDSYYNTSPGSGGKCVLPGAGKSMTVGRYHDAKRSFVGTGIKPKDLIGVPWRVAFALQEDGWWLRQDIIWAKLNPMPESVRDRCTKAHEYIFLMSKSERYYFDADAIAEPALVPASQFVPATGKNRDDATILKRRNNHGGGQLGKPGIRNRRSVWTIATEPFAGAHFAVFPSALIEPCILAGAPLGGVVLDTFFGAGTTGVAAIKHGRRFIGIELNPEYAEMASARCDEVSRQGDLFYAESQSANLAPSSS